VKLLTTVIVHVVVLAPDGPIHAVRAMPWALASLAPPPTNVRPSATVKQKERRIPSETVRIFERGVLVRGFTGLLSVVRSGGLQPGAAHGVQRSLQVATRHQTLLSVDW
jgi:hypothetical protein